MDSNKVVENIKIIRTIFGETQKELAEAIGVTHNAISNYEKGERMPDLQKIEMIALHYGIAVDALINGDLSKMDFKIEPLTWERLISTFKDMLPLISNEKALEDKYFAKGYEYSCRIINDVKQAGRSSIELCLERSLEEYQESYLQYGTKESIANMLWTLFIGYMSFADEHVEKRAEAVLYGEGVKKDFAKKYIVREINSTVSDGNLARREYVKDNYENCMLLLKMLKESKEYSELADYYLALQYLLGMVWNDASEDFNKAVGLELIRSLVALGNPYAMKISNIDLMD